MAPNRNAICKSLFILNFKRKKNIGRLVLLQILAIVAVILEWICTLVVNMVFLKLVILSVSGEVVCRLW